MDQVCVVQHGVHRDQADNHQKGWHIGRQKRYGHKEEHGSRLDVSSIGLFSDWRLCCGSSGIGVGVSAPVICFGG